MIKLVPLNWKFYFLNFSMSRHIFGISWSILKNLSTKEKPSCEQELQKYQKIYERFGFV